MRIYLISLILVMGVSSSLMAQTEKSNRKKDFDFWLGEWTIYHTGTTMVAGNCSVQLDSNNSIKEEYVAISGGFEGVSYSVYNDEDDNWVYNWSDSEGKVIKVKGKFKNGKMKLETAVEDDEGNITKNKIEWEPNDDGTIRQIWEQKQNTDKAKWEVVFDGIYRRKPSE